MTWVKSKSLYQENFIKPVLEQRDLVADIRLLQGKSLDRRINLLISAKSCYLRSEAMRGKIFPHLKVDIQEDPSRENGQTSPLEKNLSGLMGISGRGKIVVLGPQIAYFEKPCLVRV